MNGCIRKIVKIFRALKYPKTRLALLRYGVLAAMEHLEVIKSLYINTVIDIGANRGQFALVARQNHPDARIYSFEPLEKAAIIYRRVFNNDPVTVLFPVAIGSTSGESIIHVSRRDDSSSLLPITDKQNKLFPGTEEQSIDTIQIGHLAEYIEEDKIQEPALIKLDVQGYELEALKGCIGLLHKFGYVYAECSFTELYAGQAMADEVVCYLHKKGFMLAGIYNVHYDRDGIAVQADFLFVREKGKE